MFWDTQSRHCFRLMLPVSLSHNRSGQAAGPGHSRRVRLVLPETMTCPSGLNATLFTALVWPLSGGPRGRVVSASQNRSVVSSLPETMRCLSGLIATLETQPECPMTGVPICWPVLGFHSRRVLSQLPETMRRPSGLTATLVTVLGVGMILRVFGRVISPASRLPTVSALDATRGAATIC